MIGSVPCPQKWQIHCLLSLLVILPLQAIGNAEYEQCLSDAVQQGESALTVAEIKRRCESLRAEQTQSDTGQSSVNTTDGGSALSKRLQAEEANEERPFVITPHRPNYLLVSSWNAPSSTSNPFIQSEQIELDDAEINFQISFKVPIWRNIFAQNVDAYFAYTAQSWWQLFNSDISSPFRETNYEPELYVRNFTNYDVFGFTLAGWSVGINHQSNGRSEPLSRSWNRVMGRLGFVVRDDTTVMLRLWDRIEEASDDDDNPDIEDFRGNGDLRVIWTPGQSTYTAMLRNARKNGAYELTWSYPLGKVFRFYAQYYDGYGESLIDYDRSVSRFSLGFSVSDYLMNGSYQ